MKKIHLNEEDFEMPISRQGSHADEDVELGIRLYDLTWAYLEDQHQVINMKIKQKLEKYLFFLEELSIKHPRQARFFKIVLWMGFPLEMLGFTLAKKGYKRFVK